MPITVKDSAVVLLRPSNAPRVQDVTLGGAHDVNTTRPPRDVVRVESAGLRVLGWFMYAVYRQCHAWIESTQGSAGHSCVLDIVFGAKFDVVADVQYGSNVVVKATTTKASTGCLTAAVPGG